MVPGVDHFSNECNFLSNLNQISLKSPVSPLLNIILIKYSQKDAELNEILIRKMVHPGTKSRVFRCVNYVKICVKISESVLENCDNYLYKLNQKLSQ